MARKVVNRKELRAQADAAEARGKTTEKKEKVAKEPKAKKEKAVKEPKPAAKKTVRKKVEKVEEKYVRQSGGKGQYGHVKITIKPMEKLEEGAKIPKNVSRYDEFEFVNSIKGGVIPQEFIPAVETEAPWQPVQYLPISGATSFVRVAF